MEATRKALEDLQAEHRVGVQRIAEWAGEASTTLVSLGMSPIPVSELSVSISDALPVLDSTADRLPSPGSDPRGPPRGRGQQALSGDG
jgi:hypothetical protein